MKKEQRAKKLCRNFHVIQSDKNAKLEFTKAFGIINCDYDQMMKNGQKKFALVKFL